MIKIGHELISGYYIWKIADLYMKYKEKIVIFWKLLTHDCIWEWSKIRSLLDPLLSGDPLTVNSILYQGHFRGYISNNQSMTSLQNLYESEQRFYERVETFQMCMKGYIYLAWHDIGCC